MKALWTRFVWVLALVGFSTVAAAEVAPDVLVKKTAEEVLEIVRNDKDIQNGDQKKIFDLAETKILPNFDFERVCRLVLGRNWANATDEQKAQFQKEFRSLLLRTYSSALSKYRNQTIEYLPFRLQPEATRATVKTRILQPGGQPIGLDYALEKGPSGWKVFDIVIEDVSLVTNYRSQFSNEIRQVGGMDGLIQRLAEKNREAGV
ncbi:MAG: ABC transporter substrate-binding protein [Methylophilaceae bacterium]|jgi:phospholipid transport system substrate-binding protein|nr:ABC transporter substrate-binding protein [Methylophilaceae bacterium]